MKSSFILLLSIITLNSMAKIAIHGHRGARSILPENTMAAIKYAVENEIDVIEFDLAVTKDKVVVLSHDPILNKENCDLPNKFQGTPVTYYSVNSKDVLNIKCGKSQPKKYPKQKALPNEKIPSLKQVLTYLNKVKYKGLLNIETKIFPFAPEATPTPKEFAKLVVQEAKTYHRPSNVIIQSFDYRTLVEVQRLNKVLKTSLLTYGNLLPLVPIFKKYKFNYWSPNHKWMTKEMIKSLEKIGVETHPWTLNKPEDWKKAIAKGVHGIITDDPVALKKYLKRK
ncbi:MAG: glycerophosphodiester phosphodiesterase [Oligoflexia bacterium]|nr:glycerophosphodiester phosphodiesterase [Oligoflexia bacterium]